MGFFSDIGDAISSAAKTAFQYSPPVLGAKVGSKVLTSKPVQSVVGNIPVVNTLTKEVAQVGSLPSRIIAGDREAAQQALQFGSQLGGIAGVPLGGIPGISLDSPVPPGASTFLPVGAMPQAPQSLASATALPVRSDTGSGNIPLYFILGAAGVGAYILLRRKRR